MTYPHETRTALVAGVVGRAGEALLNEVLARGNHRRVIALAESPMSMGVRRLELATLDALPPIDDLYLLPTDADEPGTRSYYGRDAPFVQIDDRRAVAVARAASAAGASRLVLISPAAPWQQISGLNAGLTSDAEREIAALPVERMVVLRPTRQSRAPGGNLLQRMVHAYLSVQMLMLPKSVPLVTSVHLARVAVDALANASPGITVLGAERIAQWFAAEPAAASDGQAIR